MNEEVKYNSNGRDIPPDVQEKLISAAYGDTGLSERIKIQLLIRKNPEYKKFYNEFHKTAQAVHKIKLYDCPEEIIEKASDLVDKEVQKSGKSVTALLFDRPVIAVFTAVILLGAALITFNITHHQIQVKDEPKYSGAEVQMAEQQVKSSFVTISRLLNKTTEKLEKDILRQKVSKPIKQGVEVINQLFPKGA